MTSTNQPPAWAMKAADTAMKRLGCGGLQRLAGREEIARIIADTCPAGKLIHALEDVRKWVLK